MRRSSFPLSASALAVLAGGSLLACAPAPSGSPRPSGDAAAKAELPALPRPTEHWLDEDAEHENKEGRFAWLEELHRAAPDVDWRAIEERNRLAEIERRNQLAESPAPNQYVWHEVGSKNQAGRMQCAVFAPDGQSLYAGSALGGLWHGNVDGTGWTPLGDNVGGGMAELVALPGESAGDPDVLVTLGSSSIFGSAPQIFVTRDLGLTWELATGLDNVSDIRMLGRFQDAASTLVAACTQAGKLTIYASTDYGRSFQQRWQAGANSAGWMWIPREGPGAQSTIYVATKGRVRVSTDGGFTFSLLATIDTSSTRAVIAGSEAGAPQLYAAFQIGGTWELHVSTDGTNFDYARDLSDFWEGSLCASRTNPDLVMYGGVECWRSFTAGAAVAKINGWGEYYGDKQNKLHADIPGIHCWADPSDPARDVWFISTDGGLYESRDDGVSVLNLSLQGLGVSQYYSTHTSANDPNLVLAGAQDQGYQRGTVEPPAGLGATGPTSGFNQLISGDYAHLTSGDGTHELVYSVYPGFILIQDGEIGPNLHQDSFPNGAPTPWLPFILGDPLDNETFFFGSSQLWRYDRLTAANWAASVHSSQVFDAGGGSYITAMAFAPSDPQRMYAVNTAGWLYASTDHGVTWSATSSGAPGDHYLYGQGIAVHPNDPDEVVVGGSGYSTPGVIRSIDGGQTWTPIVNGLPQTVVYDLCFAPDGSGDVYAGTESGAWRWDRATDTWENIMSNVAPITIYWSVEAVAPDIVRYGTYGRGIWDYKVPIAGDFAQYGQGKVNSLGEEPRLDGLGSPTLTQNDFVLEGVLGVPQKPGLVIWSAGQAALPFFGGTLWLAPPLVRDTLFLWDPTYYMSVPVPVDPTMVGKDRYYQLWYRDPQHADGTGVGLSSALRVVFGP